jgi:HSP20 family protein
VDVIRGEDRLTVRADVPGMTPDEVEIKVEDGVLTVSGEHSEGHEEEKERYVRREHRSGSFSRSMTLPDGVDPEQIETTCKDGVLEVQIPLPAAEEKAKEPVKITPKAG